MATLTPEEREQYQREITEKLGKQKGERGDDVIRATGAGEAGGFYAYGRAERPDPQATVTAVEEEARRREWERKQAEERERIRLEQEKEAERERKLQEWIESEKRRLNRSLIRVLFKSSFPKGS